MKECWVNVGENKEHLIYHSDYTSKCWIYAPWATAKYRLHVKMKDKPGLVHKYRWTFIEPCFNGCVIQDIDKRFGPITDNYNGGGACDLIIIADIKYGTKEVKEWWRL